MTIFPAVLSSGVIPMDKPVVPNAELTSNMISIIEKFSVAFNITTAVKQSSMAKKLTTTDFRISSSCSSRPNTLIALCPFAKLMISNMTTAKVVVLIPPPTELGEAPINIKKQQQQRTMHI